VGERSSDHPDDQFSVGGGPADIGNSGPSGDASASASGPASGPESGASGPSASGPRGRGRPRKSAGPSAQKAGRPNDPIRLRVDEVSRAPKRERAATPTKAKPGDDGDATQASTALLQLVELAALATVGPAGAFTPIERAMVEPSMVRILARMDAATVARYGALADPVVLCLGLGMWGLRIMASRKPAAPPDTANRAQQTAPGMPKAAPAESPGLARVEAATAPGEHVPAHAGANGFAPISPLIVGHIESGDMSPLE